MMNKSQADKALNDIVAAIKNSSSFLVSAHESPDGDAIASTLALYNALTEMGKEVVAYNADAVPRKLAFLPGAEMLVSSIEAQRHFDVGIILDVGELRRARVDIKQKCDLVINIDHHPYSEDFGDIYYVDTRASATGVLIYRVLEQMGWPLSHKVAENIYTAILSDTGSFRYSSANAEAFRVAGSMIECGVDPWKIAGGLYESQEAERLRLLAMALATLKISACGRVAAIYVDRHMLDEVGVGAEMADSFVNYPRSIEGVEVAVFMRELSDGEYKLSMRSKGKVDVGQLARDLGGGGHKNAAGAELRGDLNQLTDQVFERLQPLLD